MEYNRGTAAAHTYLYTSDPEWPLPDLKSFSDVERAEIMARAMECEASYRILLDVAGGGDGDRLRFDRAITLHDHVSAYEDAQNARVADVLDRQPRSA